MASIELHKRAPKNKDLEISFVASTPLCVSPHLPCFGVPVFAKARHTGIGIFVKRMARWGKIPIYVLRRQARFCHNFFRGIYMTESVFDLVVQILREYERITGKSCFEIANRMGIEVSNYYLYRAGIGNPTCKTIDKIIEVVLAEHPEIICAIVNRLNENLKGMLETQELSKKA